MIVDEGLEYHVQALSALEGSSGKIAHFVGILGDGDLEGKYTAHEGHHCNIASCCGTTSVLRRRSKMVHYDRYWPTRTRGGGGSGMPERLMSADF
jgi:hypothetical protein